MDALETVIEVNPDMTFLDLWVEAKILYPKLPAKSQFYEWLKHTWCIDPQTRGGFKPRKTYAQQHLNRLIRFAELKRECGTLKAAQEALLAEMKQRPDHYLIKD